MQQGPPDCTGPGSCSRRGHKSLRGRPRTPPKGLRDTDGLSERSEGAQRETAPPVTFPGMDERSQGVSTHRPLLVYQYYRARECRPDVGKFLQRDPIGYRAGANLQNYVANSPLTYADPYGKVGGCVIAALVVFCIGWGLAGEAGGEPPPPPHLTPAELDAAEKKAKDLEEREELDRMKAGPV